MRLFPALSGFALATLISVPAVAGDDTIREELTRYNDRYNEIVASYDLEAFVALYNDAPIWIAPEEAPVSGLDVPSGTFGFISQNEGQLTHTFDELFVSEDATQAVMIGTYDLNVETVSVAATGTYLFVLERNGEGWDIVVDMFNQHKAE